VVARLAAIAAVIAPWLALTPLARTNASTVALYAITLVAAFHGLGIVVAWASRRYAAPAFLAIQWGVAAAIAIGGIAMSLHVYTERVQWFVVFFGAAMHSGAMLWRFSDTRDVVAHQLRWDRSRLWFVIIAALVALGLIHVVGSAGDVNGRAFDDDGNVFAQVKRLVDTGALTDRIGFPRTSQLGGAVTLDSLATIAGDVRFLRMMDALELVLFLALVCSRIRTRDATSAIWAAIVVLLISALSLLQSEPLPLWTTTALGMALFATVETTTDDQRTAIPAALVAGALVAVRMELAPLAVVGFFAAWWAAGGFGRTLAGLAGIALIAVVPYLVARSLAVGDVEAASHGSLIVRIAIFVPVTLVASAILLLPFDDRTRAQRAVAWGAGAAIAGIASQLVGERGVSVQYLWPIAIIYGSKLVIELSRGDRAVVPAAAMITALVAIVMIDDGRETPGRPRWSHRYEELVYGVHYLHTRDVEPIGNTYASALASVPRGARVAVWVSAPERLDYAQFELVDLRTPRIAPLRKHDFAPHESRLDKLVAASGAQYLLVEGDDRVAERAQKSLTYRILCTPSFAVATCADDLDRIAHVTPGTLALVRLPR